MLTIFGSALVWQLFAAGTDRTGASECGLALQIECNREVYLLGEPVLLRATLLNTTDKPLGVVRAHPRVPGRLRGLRAVVTREGSDPEEYDQGADCYRSRKVLLEPGAAWTFPVRMVYWSRRASGLLFERPGSYRAKLLYPLVSKEGARVVSNEVRFSVKAPEGVDDAVWRKINTRQFLMFLQSGEIEGPERAVWDLAAEVLSRWRESTYAPAIQWSLRAYLATTIPRVDQLRRMAGIAPRGVYSRPDVECWPAPPITVSSREGAMLFPDDRRLDNTHDWRLLDFELADPVLSHSEHLYRVPLRLHPSLAGQYQLLGHSGTRESLREFMVSVMPPGTKWVKDGDGYMLVPEENGKP